MIFGSTTVDVLRTVTPAPTDSYGDPVETDDVALAGLPVDIADATRTRRDPADGRLVTIAQFKVTVRASCPFEIKPTDRLRDNRTGQILQVETISTTTAWAGRRRQLTCTEAG